LPDLIHCRLGADQLDAFHRMIQRERGGNRLRLDRQMICGHSVLFRRGSVGAQRAQGRRQYPMEHGEGRSKGWSS
jgi:hypothetical protein